MRPTAAGVGLLLVLTACSRDQSNPFAAVSASRPPSSDAVLVFVSASWANEPGQPRELMALNADGTRLERLTTCAQAGTACDTAQVALAPDSARLAAVRSLSTPGGATPALFFMDLSRSVEQRLYPQLEVPAVDWSALILDGSTRLVFSSRGAQQSGNEDLYVSLPDGTAPSPLMSTPAVRELNPRLDRLGLGFIVYEHVDEAGVSRIYSYPQVPLTTGAAEGPALPGTPYVVGADANPVFSPDVRAVLFRRLTGIGDDGLGTWDLMIINLDGSGLRTLATGAAYRGPADWGTGGIVFVERAEGSHLAQLVVVQPDGSGRTVIRSEDAAFRMDAPRWIPAGWPRARVG